MSGQIQRGNDRGGVRDFLDGLPIHCGTGLELLMEDGSWRPVRYEVEHRPRDDGRMEIVAQLYFTVPVGGRPTEKTDDGDWRYYNPVVHFTPPHWATVRWPVRR